MKKTLRFLGLAFVACSLFVACGDDEDNKNEEETVKDGIAVTFDTDAWEAADILGIDYSSNYQLLQLGAFKNYDSETMPFVQGYVPSVVSNVTWSGNTSSGDYHYMFYYENDNDLTTYENSQYPNWQPTANDFKETITAIDLTALTLSGTCTGSMRYFPDIINENVETPTTKALTVTINNATWESVESSKGGRTMKTMGNLVK